MDVFRTAVISLSEKQRASNAYLERRRLTKETLKNNCFSFELLKIRSTDFGVEILHHILWRSF